MLRGGNSWAASATDIPSAAHKGGVDHGAKTDLPRSPELSGRGWFQPTSCASIVSGKPTESQSTETTQLFFGRALRHVPGLAVLLVISRPLERSGNDARDTRAPCLRLNRVNRGLRHLHPVAPDDLLGSLVLGSFAI